MPVYIAHPNKWAASQGYTLAPTPVSEDIFSVIDGNRAVGILRRTVNGFEFHNNSAPDTSDVTDTVVSSSSDFFESRNFGISGPTLDMSKLEIKSPNEISLGPQASGTGETEHISECNFWLPFAAREYNLSPNIRDYVVVPLPVMISDLPNTNGDSLSLPEMLRFNTQVGRQMYKTFQGMGVYKEHKNDVEKNASGVILDAFLRPIKKFGRGKYFKVVQLLGIDRTKDPVLAKSVLDKTSNAYSVGFQYTSYTCSICGQRVGKGINLTPCEHTRLFQPTYRLPDGRLVFRRCENAKGFECSAVANPAFTIAIGPTVFDASAI